MTLQIIVVLFFVAVIMALFALYAGYATFRSSPQYELKSRLRNLAVRREAGLSSELTIEILGEMNPLDKFLYQLPLVRRLDKLLDNAGVKMDMKIFLGIMFIGALAGLILGLALGRGIIFSILFVFIGGLAPLYYLRIKKGRRLDKFTEQFPAALDMIARSLRAGHAFSMAVQMIGNEMSDPVSTLFKTAYEEQTLGLSVPDALAQMMERMPSMDLRLFVTAVNIHREVGGNLAETLEKLGETIRERIRIRRQVKVYTAQGRLTGYILAALPIAMACFIYILMPDYMKELIEVKQGRIAIAVAVSAQIIGFFIIRRLINIKI